MYYIIICNGFSFIINLLIEYSLKACKINFCTHAMSTSMYIYSNIY